MIHNASVEVLENQTVAQAFSQLRKKGLARAIGVSTYTPAETRKALDAGIWDVVELSFNLMDQRQGQFFADAQRRGIGVVIRSVLLKGILTDKGRNLRPQLAGVERHREVYNQLLNKKAMTLSELAIKFVLSQKEVSSILVGIDRMEYLKSALAVADGDYLDEETLAVAAKLAYPEPEFLDLHKWDVMGWLG